MSGKTFDTGLVLLTMGAIGMIAGMVYGVGVFVVGVLLYGAGLATMFSIGEEHA